MIPVTIIIAFRHLILGVFKHQYETGSTALTWLMLTVPLVYINSTLANKVVVAGRVRIAWPLRLFARCSQYRPQHLPDSQVVDERRSLRHLRLRDGLYCSARTLGTAHPAPGESSSVNASILNAQTVKPRPIGTLASRPLHAGSIVRWTLAAVLLGCALALGGLPGIYVLLVLAAAIVFAGIALRFPAFTMTASIWCLALVPFSWGLTTGVLPKIFGDECLLFLYLIVLPFLYLSRSRTWQPGFRNLYWALSLFLFMQSLSLLAGSDLVAFRNFLETDFPRPLPPSPLPPGIRQHPED